MLPIHIQGEWFRVAGKAMHHDDWERIVVVMISSVGSSATPD